MFSRFSSAGSFNPFITVWEVSFIDFHDPFQYHHLILIGNELPNQEQERIAHIEYGIDRTVKIGGSLKYRHVIQRI